MKNRIVACFLAIIMVLYMFITIVPAVFAQDDTITISSEEDFINFSKQCTLDTWSQGKTVNLTCNLDFSKKEFLSVPTFGGTFNGNGYIISGINISKNGSYLGVFRYIQNGGKVTSLNVKANIIPNGSKSFIGGITGENSGIIEQCTFDGTVKGENAIGSIAGSNTDNGQIVACTSSGNIVGENSIGGIAGKNDGLILSCINNASINTVYEEKKNDISNIETDSGAVIENYKNKKEEAEEETVLGHSDTGGIAGYSSGIIQGCTNNADVGYKHVGYNVGGIAGRQSGYLLGCQNFGFIQGRKDVGGIVGQVEPYVLLQTSESTLQDIRQELDNLHQMVNRFTADTESLTDNSENHLSNISEYAKNAQDNTEILLNQGTDFVDDNLAEINAQTAILSNTLDKLTPVFENLENGSENLADAFDDVVDALDDIELYAPDLYDEINDINSALSRISGAERSIKKAVSNAKDAVDDLGEAIGFNNKAQVNTAVSEFSSAIQDIITANETIKTSLDAIEAILNSKPEDFESIGINAKAIAEHIKTIKGSTDTTVSALKTVVNSLNTIINNTKIDFSKFKSAAQYIDDAIMYLEDAMSSISKGLKELGSSVEHLYEGLDNYLTDVSDQLNTSKDDLADAVNSLSYATDDIKDAIGNAKDIISDLSNEETLEFVKLGDDFKTASENLFNSLSDISNEIDELKSTISGSKDCITGDITSISNQFNLVMNLLADKYNEIKNEVTDSTDRFIDTSDEDIENTKQGKVAECYNKGNIEADRNTGGIAGAMAIEYSKDPEDDIEKPNTLNFTYRTKAVLQGCINDGKIVGKKDCTGGVTGFAKIGTVYECENYGDTESTNGNYVGGVAGKSESTVRKCYAKNKLTGKEYIGGIVGKSDIVTACCAIVNVNGDENIGAVCGNAENKDNLYKNFFTDNGLGAVDGISYAGKAESISFEELANIADIPVRFISFTVTFIADDKVVEIQEIKYGDDTAKIKYPKIPEKDGYFGNWTPIEAETVTENIEVVCDYQPYITILSSSEKNENGKLSLGLAEGEFTDKAELHITESDKTPPVSSQDNVKVYDVSLINTDIQDNDTVTIRLLNENKGKVTAWKLTDGKWDKIKGKNRGKYTILQITGTESTICLQYTKKGFSLVWLLPILLIIIAIPLIVIKKKRKK